MPNVEGHILTVKIDDIDQTTTIVCRCAFTMRLPVLTGAAGSPVAARQVAEYHRKAISESAHICIVYPEESFSWLCALCLSHREGFDTWERAQASAYHHAHMFTGVVVLKLDLTSIFDSLGTPVSTEEMKAFSRRQSSIEAFLNEQV